MTPSQDEIAEALHKLINAPTWAGRKLIVEAHRDVGIAFGLPFQFDAVVAAVVGLERADGSRQKIGQVLGAQGHLFRLAQKLLPELDQLEEYVRVYEGYAPLYPLLCLSCAPDTTAARDSRRGIVEGSASRVANRRVPGQACLRHRGPSHLAA